uniref:Secreted protein n=1 Tax=Meloidogyne incognita TaxID=6306 RepID=A0A914KSJ0_MELIC
MLLRFRGRRFEPLAGQIFLKFFSHLTTWTASTSLTQCVLDNAHIMPFRELSSRSRIHKGFQCFTIWI